jgi:alginate O-acetyltransferase complex protein AlgI
MLFNSFLFLALLGVALSIRWSSGLPWYARKTGLLAVSFLFYASWIPAHFLLLLGLTLFVQLMAGFLVRAVAPSTRRWLLAAGIVGALAPLLVYKYALFVTTLVVRLLGADGYAPGGQFFELILPVGISFYTFEAISYLIDLYRDGAKAKASLIDFALFLAFFPRMASGPIMRAAEFIPQCHNPAPYAPQAVLSGLRLLVFGLFQKIVMADWAFAPTADRAFLYDVQNAPLSAWAGVIAFAFQIFFDFAGYSTAAIGIARMLGFDLPLNFNSPYAAQSFSEFWKRWHISLSSWLRDYLYIPLGGNRGALWRTHFNLIATMLIGGLWHGAALRFIAWGGLHGLLLVAQRILPLPGGASPQQPSRVPFLSAVLVFGCVCFTWVFFRATSLKHALTYCQSMLGIGGGQDLPSGLLLQTLSLGALCFACQWMTRHTSLDQLFDRCSRPARVAAFTAICILILLSPEENRAFIYFQF